MFIASKTGCLLTKVKAPTRCGTGAPRTEHGGNMPRIQPFPTEGELAESMNRTREELEEILWKQPGKVRSYKMMSVWQNEMGQLEQYGSGPNFQGGLLTLCTCQRNFRAEKRNPDEWWQDNWWIAGFSSPNCCNQTWLVYLAQVERAYESQAELWADLPQRLRIAKSTTQNPLGDVYQPNPSSRSQDRHSVAHYHPPLVGHSHRETADDDSWHDDIEFFHARFRRRPLLLVAKPRMTFLWQQPMLYLKRHERNQTWGSVAALLAKLRSA